MEDCRLPADAGLIDRCAAIDVCSTVEKQSGCCRVAVFRGHMQERSSLKQEVAPAGLAAIEFRKTLIHERGIRVNLLSQTIEPAAEQLQHGWRAACFVANPNFVEAFAHAPTMTKPASNANLRGTFLVFQL